MTSETRGYAIVLSALLLLAGGAGAGHAAPDKLGKVNVLGVWKGEELRSFRAVVKPWEKETGGKMRFEGSRDLSAVLTARAAKGDAPDVAILPNPGLMVQLAKTKKLVPLDGMLDMTHFEAEYARTWIELGSVEGSLYGVFYKAANKSTLWYSPQQFSDHQWPIPRTWKSLLAVSERIHEEGKTPWALGLESGDASGWPATDWIGEILLKEYGPEKYDAWVAHEIPWTDEAVRSAWENFGRIAHGEGYVAGGASGILTTGFREAAYRVFRKPPKAYLYFLGSFTKKFITERFSGLMPAKDYSFIPFPALNPAYSGAVTGGADVVVVFKDNATTRSFINYLASAEAQEIWVERGGFTAVNRKVRLHSYPDWVSARIALQLSNAKVFRFDADDQMPAEVQKAFWKGALDYVRDQASLDRVLEDIEAVARKAYR
ncbi:MAG: ABC transporter substrate-binding protein [Elusimicrobiota bacterium]